ncbi:MAG: hypothetical protein HY880_07095 [Deltaproteobacteria bacterium]|nr:hypothetical protein [Deltaproteobacteria bacterium]
MTEDKLGEQKPKDADFSRRAFIRTALIGGIAVASGAAIAKKVSSLSPNNNPQSAYLDDGLQQDNLMKGKEYVLMTRKEKEQMAKMFEDEYYKQA